MGGFWEILGLEPTRDFSAIRRAYAEKAKICHPEEDPQGFLRLRNAYQAALDCAENGFSAVQAQSPAKPENPRENKRGEIPTDSVEEPQPLAAAPEGDGWRLRGEEPETAANPYTDGEAIRRFWDLYTGKQRKDSKRWMDYFTSDAFLDMEIV